MGRIVLPWAVALIIVEVITSGICKLGNFQQLGLCYTFCYLHKEIFTLIVKKREIRKRVNH